PTPVTTTRLLNQPPTPDLTVRTLPGPEDPAELPDPRGPGQLPGLRRPGLLLGLGVRLDVLDRFLHARDLLGVLVRNLDPELLFEGHDELDGVERVGPQVVHERGVRRHFLFVDPELLHDDALHLVCYGHSILQFWRSAPGSARPGPEAPSLKPTCTCR